MLDELGIILRVLGIFNNLFLITWYLLANHTPKVSKIEIIHKNHTYLIEIFCDYMCKTFHRPQTVKTKININLEASQYLVSGNSTGSYKQNGLLLAKE